MPQILVFKIFNEWFMCQEAGNQKERDVRLENINVEDDCDDAEISESLFAGGVHGGIGEFILKIRQRMAG